MPAGAGGGSGMMPGGTGGAGGGMMPGGTGGAGGDMMAGGAGMAGGGDMGAGGGMMMSGAAGGMGMAPDVAPGSMGGDESYYGSGSSALTTDDLIDAITMLVDPASWNQNGGDATLLAMGGRFVVQQTAENHQRIGELLRALRVQGARPMVTIEAVWLSLDSQELAVLKGESERRRPLPAGQVDRAALGKLSREKAAFRGQVTCHSGQTVHLVSGAMHTKIQGATPVVGGSSEPAYQPILLTPHLGALLQVTPTVSRETESVMIDVQSLVTREIASAEAGVDFGAGSSGASAKSGSGSGLGAGVDVRVDRLHVAAQQLQTSLHIPLGTATLVGGMTYPARDNEESGQQLYLVIEVSSREPPGLTAEEGR